MRPLTDHTPKPLLKVGGKPLIAWHLEKLAAAGFEKVVINHAHLGNQIVNYLGRGAAFGVSIEYSSESQGALETAGGIIKALPLLGEQPFLLVNGDVWTDFDFATLLPAEQSGLSALLPDDFLAELVLVRNPDHNLKGDFSLSQGLLQEKLPSCESFTYSGIGLYSPELFKGLPLQAMALAPLIRRALAHLRVSARIYQGQWCDVGTPERLAWLNQQLEFD